MEKTKGRIWILVIAALMLILLGWTVWQNARVSERIDSSVKSTTMLDATVIQYHLSSIPTAAYNNETADADGDGSITIVDATSIQRHLVALPCNENIGKQV